MVTTKHYCATCNEAFFDLPEAIIHEKKPIIGKFYENKIAKDQNGNYDLFLKKDISLDHEVNYWVIKLIPNGLVRAKISNEIYSASQIKDYLNSGNLLSVSEEELSKLEELAKIKKNASDAKEIRFFWQEFDSLESI